MDGTPDDSIDSQLALWAKIQAQEYQYRLLFHLSEKEMAEESFDTVMINLKLNEFFAKKEKIKQSMEEQKARLAK